MFDSGVCYRLYTQEHYDKLPQFSTPEILRVNLANVLLHLSALSMKNYHNFEFMDKPSLAVSLADLLLSIIYLLLIPFQNITKSANLLETLDAVKKTEKDEYEVSIAAFCRLKVVNN